jgi:hypothetical protein
LRKEPDDNKPNELEAGPLEALARCLLPAIRSYFESDEGQRDFAEWQVRTGKSTDRKEVDESAA